MPDDDVSPAQLATEHWDWLETVLRMEEEAKMQLVGKLFRDAFVHGYKHGHEDASREEVEEETPDGQP